MGLLDNLTPRSRRWQETARKCSEAVSRAGLYQARQCGAGRPMDGARDLARLYSVQSKPTDWREYGDVAFHLLAAWPPDLAYLILYGLREVCSEAGAQDPVPSVLRAMEMICHFQPQNALLRLSVSAQVQELIDNAEMRARRGARIVVRELSAVPLRWASGIYASMDPMFKRFVDEELQQFNPEGARILSKGSRAYLLTKPGLLRTVFRTLFGKDATRENGR